MLATAFILGLAGSLHCAGMCSPLAFAVTSMSRSVWLNRLVYNLGRIMTYGILGAVVSTVGVALPLERFQNVLSVGMGLMLIATAVVGASRFQFKFLNTWVQKFSSKIRSWFSREIKRKNSVSYLILGALNGLLPCGLTLLALTTCLILPNATGGLYYMLFFGLGTLPVMLGFVSIVQLVTQKLRFSMSRVNAVMLIVAGSMLIGRTIYFSSVHHPAPPSANVEMCK